MNTLTIFPVLLALSLLYTLSHAETPECDIGTFHSGMACLPCPKGTYQDEKGATECIPCPKGFFNDLQGAPGVDRCKPCPINTFSTVLGAESAAVCMPCPPGTTAPEGVDRCLSCPAGSFLSKCPQGVEIFVGPEMECQVCVVFGRCEVRPLELKCRQCEERTFSARPNSLKCEFCPGNTISEVGSSSCKLCPPGQGNRNFDGVCAPCQSFLFQDGSFGFCQSCPSGFRGNKREGATSCVPCPEGTAGTSGECKRCGPGENTGVIGATFCAPDDTPCPSNFFRDFRGNCKRCKKFERYNLREKRCDRCPENSVSNGGLDTVCRQCGSGERRIESFMTNDMDAREAACACKDGFARTPEGRCERCAPGFFRGEFFEGDLTNGASCLKCFQGSIAKRAGSTKCEQCPPGTFQPLRGQTSCMRCPPGTVSNEFSSACNDPATGCPKGSTRVNIDRTTFNCEEPIPPRVPPCSIFERLVMRTGRCVNCPANFISDGGRDRTCERCNGIIWGDDECKCISDPVGPRELFDGICRTCRPGKFGILGVEGCTLCPAGTFRGRLGNTEECEFCSPGTFSGPGAATCRPCPDGTDSFGFGYANCVVPGSLA